MTTLSAARKKSITRDWQKLVPQFAALRPMSLVRRVGPLVQGICLDRDSSNSAYLPTTFVHCLCRPFPVLSLTLGQPLLASRSGTIQRISVQFHSTHYVEACNRLLAASLMRVDGDWRLSDLLYAYTNYRQLGRPDSRYPVLLIEDAISVCAWLGNESDASRMVIEACDEAKHWPENVLARREGLSEWESSLKGIAASGKELRRIAEEQVDLLRLGSAPVCQLLQS